MTEIATQATVRSSAAAQSRAEADNALIVAALALKTEMAECYQELAEQMEHCNNCEAAETFRQLVERQHQHLKTLSELEPNSQPSATPAWIQNGGFETPTTDLFANAHYLMCPHQVVKMALDIERQNQQRLDNRLETQPPPQSLLYQHPLRLSYQQQHSLHLQHLEQLLNTLPAPAPHWDDDPDPPNIDD